MTHSIWIMNNAILGPLWLWNIQKHDFKWIQTSFLCQKWFSKKQKPSFEILTMYYYNNRLLYKIISGFSSSFPVTSGTFVRLQSSPFASRNFDPWYLLEIYFRWQLTVYDSLPVNDITNYLIWFIESQLVIFAPLSSILIFHYSYKYWKTHPYQNSQIFILRTLDPHCRILNPD